MSSSGTPTLCFGFLLLFSCLFVVLKDRVSGLGLDDLARLGGGD